jgi:hypothetical protein
MVWRGVIIEESLEDKSLLKLVKIVKTTESKLEGEEEKGVRHFHAVDVADEDVDMFAEWAALAIKRKWWIHLVNGKEMIIILKTRIFHYRKGDKKALNEIRCYVENQGILQLPDETLMDNPYE